MEKTLMLGKTESRRRKGRQKMRRLDGITDSMDISLNRLQEMVKDRESRCAAGPWGLKESDTAFSCLACNVWCLGSNGRKEEEYPGFVP